MKAVIMAGGDGSRLRPITCSMPEAMAPVMNKPIMEYTIELLKNNGFDDIGIILNYMPTSVIDYFKEGKDFGVNITYFTEREPLKAEGAIKNISEFLTEPFLIIPADIVTDMDLKKVVEFHSEKNAKFTVVAGHMDVPLDHTLVQADQDGMIVKLVDKPTWSEVFTDMVNTKIYYCHPSVLEDIPFDNDNDFVNDLFPNLIKQGNALYAYSTKEYWCEINDLSSYRQCHFDILNNMVKLKLKARKIDEGLYIEEGVDIDDSALLMPPVYIGRNSIIGRYAQIESFSILGDYTTIGSYTKIKRAIIHDNVKFGNGCEIKGSIICSNCLFKDRSLCFEQAVVGEKTIVGQNSLIKPNVRVWPYKEIDNNTTINGNLIWNDRKNKHFFEDGMITGEVNVDITPDFIVKLGQSFTGVLGNKVKIAVSSNNNNASKMVKNAIMSGIMSAGGNVFDIGIQPSPVLRNEVITSKLDGGILIICETTRDYVSAKISFVNKHGVNIDKTVQLQMENSLDSFEFLICNGAKIGDYVKITNSKENYIKAIREYVSKISRRQNIIVGLPSEYCINFFYEIFMDSNVDFDIKLSNVTKEDVVNKYDLGINFKDNCESIGLIDDKGYVIDDDLQLVLSVLIVLKLNKDAKIYIPDYAPMVTEKIILDNKGSKFTKKSVNEIRSKYEIDQYYFKYDGFQSLAMILYYLSQNSTTLSDIIAHIPPFFLSKREIEISKQAKGKILNLIMSKDNNDIISVGEGVKIYKDGGWVLLVPSEKESTYKVISEGYNQEYANDLTEFYVNLVKDIDNEL